MTDAGSAELFAALFADRVRYNHALGCWLIWQKDWWAADESDEIVRLVKKAARMRTMARTDFSDGQSQEKFKKWLPQSEGLYRINAVLRLSKSDPALRDNGKGWNADPMLLGVQNGVIDLRTGKLRPGNQADRITLHTDVCFDPEARCPRWEQFMSEIFGGDSKLMAYIHKAVGYSLTGSTKEQVIFLCWGTGANGKSTFLDVTRHVLGDSGYAYNLPFSAFEIKARSVINNDIAPLQHKRFVTALETNDQVELNEARIKALTGCDPITARFLYHENFTFTPVAKFWLAFNHKPTVRDDSHGFWRRVRLIPFTQEFSGENRDENLVDTLKAEAPGILNWAIEGCLKWQAEGLKVPEVIAVASEAYREESDPLKEFLEDCCEPIAGASVSVGNLRHAYTKWCESTGNQPLDPRPLNVKMEARGFVRGRSKDRDRTRIWVGLKLKPSSVASESPELGTTSDRSEVLFIN